MQNNSIEISFSADFCIDEDKLDFIISGLGNKRQEQILKVSPLLYDYIYTKAETVHYKNRESTFCSIPIEVDWNLTDYDYKFENK